jgi:UDP-3-O-[3-hydroxymyristoyl] N-acetylglucosamine deacetylase/3-hydroxyacyl-[acyl-carrier-protein] dehydratase
VRGTAVLEGVGVHTGAATRVTVRGAASGAGIAFVRTDLAGAPRIPAVVDAVAAVERRTALSADGAEVHTVEHLLAAAVALELDDLTIEITGPEPPILDGSFQPYLEALRSAGPVEQAEGHADEFVVREAFSVTEGDATYLIGPAPRFQLSTNIEFPHPAIGHQSLSVPVNEAAFAAELAPARTFGFLAEVEALRAKGLITAASTENAIVLDATGVVGTTLRWPDEFVRHKAADVIGDLALVGGRIRAHVVATRPSHRGNVAAARAIRQRARRGAGPYMDVRQIVEVMPHRYPFLLVDRILEMEGKRIVGIKNVTINEPFFQGHFPGHPVMPGVLIIEAMAQAGGLLLMSLVNAEDHGSKVVYFMSLDNVKFRRPVVPGDQLRFDLEMLKFGGKTCRMKGVATVDGQVVAEAEMMAAVVDR